MTWRDKMVAAILLLVARMLADDPTIQHEIKNIANHISVNAESKIADPRTEGL